jgi:hypothetical protein
MSKNFSPKVTTLLIGVPLALSGFALWVAFALWPAQPGAPLLVREAWDAPRFWTLGVPLLLLVQAIAAGAHDGVAIGRLPLWALGGLFAGVVLLRPAGSDLGLLPLALILIGAPLYGALWVAGVVGRWIVDAMRG